MYKFKVGDRVVAKEDWHDGGIKGLEGVVGEVCLHETGVSFRGFTKGHTLNGILEDTSGWYVPANLLSLLDEEFEGNV